MKIRLALALVLLAGPVVATAEAVFARVAEDEQKQPLALQLAITSFGMRHGDHNIRVDLVSAIHIGDKEYYADLNKRFQRYDALLYELIAPKDTVVERDDSRPRSVISSTQITMKNMLALSFQLDEIDYSARNFVHADLSPSELSDSMAERGESLYVYFWRMFYASINQYAKDPLGINDMQKFSAILTAGSNNAFKVMLAYDMTDLQKYSEILGEDSDSAVIGARNQRAVDVLRQQLDSGAKKIGIFYGVAHMPDLEERLIEQLDLVYLDTVWVDAWRLDTQADR